MDLTEREWNPGPWIPDLCDTEVPRGGTLPALEPGPALVWPWTEPVSTVLMEEGQEQSHPHEPLLLHTRR